MDNVFGFYKPFVRKDYVAMLLGFAPYFYTNDYEDDKIKYGQKIVEIRARLTYLQCLKFWLSKGNNSKEINIKDNSVANRLFMEKRWNELLNELRKYNVDKNSVDIEDPRGWRYFRSYSLESDKKGFHGEDVKHRLYLNIKLEYRALFAKTFIEYCAKNKVPYYFKVLSSKGQTDTIVIYVDTDENLKSTIDIINQIYKYEEFKNTDQTQKIKFSDVTKTPPGHLYIDIVNNFLGYGFEPPISKEGKKLSYTQFMKECVTNSTEEKIKKLRERILKDFKDGKIYSVKNDANTLVPSKSEICEFDKISRLDKFNFFKKYFSYLIIIYGNEISEIVNEIEKNATMKLNLNTQTQRR